MNDNQDDLISPIFFQRYLDQNLNKSMFISLQKIKARILNWACNQELLGEPQHTECSKSSSMYKFESMDNLNVRCETHELIKDR